MKRKLGCKPLIHFSELLKKIRGFLSNLFPNVCFAEILSQETIFHWRRRCFYALRH